MGEGECALKRCMTTVVNTNKQAKQHLLLKAFGGLKIAVIIKSFFNSLFFTTHCKILTQHRIENKLKITAR